MDFSLNEEQRLLRDEIIRFATNELNSDVLERDRERAFSRELWLKCGDMGLQGLPVPEESGGSGLDALSTAIALEAFGYGCHDGGLVFAVSRVTRLDWIFAIFFFSLASPLRQSYPAEESIRGWLINVLFPPTQLFALAPPDRAPGQFSALISSAGPEWGSVAWLTGYAVICFLIGLWAARRIPLASVQ